MKRSSLQERVSKFRPDKFYEIDPWGLYYKKLRTRNLRKMDGFHSNIVSFVLSFTFTGLNKHTTESVNHESVMFFIVQAPGVNPIKRF
jgi:hypothetical protein